MSQIELYSKLQSEGPLDSVKAMGAMLAKSGMFGCQRAEQGEVLAMVCMTEQMTPVQVRNKYHIIDGNLSRKSGSALAEFKRIGGKYRWIKTGQEPDQDKNNREAIGEFTLDGETIKVRFSMEEAKLAGLIRSDSAWEKLPWKMLRARVVSDVLGMLAPEIYFGDDTDDNQTQTREIKLAGSEIETSSEPAKEPEQNPIPVQESKPEVFEAEILTKSEKEPEAKPEPAPEPEPKVESKPAAPELPTETVTALQKAIGTDAKAAMTYFFKKGWLKKGQNLEHLTPAQAKRVLGNTDAFIKKAREVAA